MRSFHISRLAGALAALALLAAAGIVARAQAPSDDDKAFFQKQIGTLVKLDPHPIAAAAEIAKVFSGSFFNVDVTVADNTNKVVAVRSGDDLVQVPIPSTTADMPELFKLVKPGFKLAGDDDGKAFEAALDAIYPIDTTFGKDDLNAEAVKHNGNEWNFVRGKFFDHFKGFVVTTKDDGSITGIKYSLEIH